MRMSYEITLEQTQKLIMTPELRQAIELLQLNSLELKEYISKELEENPVIEIDENSEDFEDIENFKEEEIDWKEYLEKYDDISYKQQKDKNPKDFNYESFVSYEPSLKEHLVSQLNLLSLDKKDVKIGINIIENIDDNGYLRQTVKEIAKQVRVTIEEVESLVKVVQSFDP